MTHWADQNLKFYRSMTIKSIAAVIKNIQFFVALVLFVVVVVVVVFLLYRSLNYVCTHR